MTVQDQDKAAARRFCGYPDRADPNGEWRACHWQDALEYRLANLTATEQAVVGRYLATLRALHEDAANAPRAGAAERAGMSDDWRRRLCAFLGVPPGPALCGSVVTPT